jgi:hypothetical protein
MEKVAWYKVIWLWVKMGVCLVILPTLLVIGLFDRD